MAVMDEPDGWSRYNATQVDREPRALVQSLLHHAGGGRDRLALDLGFGAGVETEALLRHGWRVIAIDADPKAAALLTQRLSEENAARLSILTSDFADIDPLSEVDLVHAAWSLPYAGDAFPHLWANLMSALVPGGWIGCELFGDRDTMASHPRIAAHTEAEARGLLEPLSVVEFDTIEQADMSARGLQHRHVFSVVARRPID